MLFLKWSICFSYAKVKKKKQMLYYENLKLFLLLVSINIFTIHTCLSISKWKWPWLGHKMNSLNTKKKFVLTQTRHLCHTYGTIFIQCQLMFFHVIINKLTEIFIASNVRQLCLQYLTFIDRNRHLFLFGILKTFTDVKDSNKKETNKFGLKWTSLVSHTYYSCTITLICLEHFFLFLFLLNVTSFFFFLTQPYIWTKRVIVFIYSIRKKRSFNNMNYY